MTHELTNPQVAKLARSLSTSNLKSIAKEYLEIEPETLETLERDSNSDEDFKQRIIEYWRNKNSGAGTEAKKLAKFLYLASEEGVNINIRQVERILGVPRDGATRTTGGTEPTVVEINRKLQAHYKKTKIDVAPWGKHEVKVLDIHTELSIVKQENTPNGINEIPLTSYKEIFSDIKKQNDQPPAPPPSTSVSFCCCPSGQVKPEETGDIGKRILIKGNPGMGKTTLVKKITFDYAQNTMKFLSLVFLVFLKSVPPSDRLEDAILKQIPVLPGLDISPKFVLETLKKLGSRCLVILDGLDELGSGVNEDISKFIQGEKLLETHVIVTARTHSLKHLLDHFCTIVKVNGFTREKAEEFALKILGQQSQVQSVLEFSQDLGDDFFLYQCPILLSMLCRLQKEQGVVFRDQNSSVGEVYGEMVRWLYLKFINREIMEFDRTRFDVMMDKVGSVALQTLLQSSSCRREKSEILKQVGKHAFDYGFLIGDDNMGPIPVVTADILVTFIHTSIREFFGAFFFVSELTRGGDVKELLKSDKFKSPILMTNLLFLHFCLWFLYSDQKTFKVRNRDIAQEKLERFCFKQLSPNFLDLPQIVRDFPAMNVDLALRKHDGLVLTFFKKVFKRCAPISLTFGPQKVLSWVWPHLKRKPKVVVSKANDAFELRSLVDGVSVVRFEKQAAEFPGELLDMCGDNAENKHLLYVQVSKRFSVPQVVSQNCKYLKTVSEGLDFRDIPNFPQLTSLYFHDQKFDDSRIDRLRSAAKEAKMPNLTDLSFINCTGLTGRMAAVLQAHRTKLFHLNVRGTEIDSEDAIALTHTGIRSLETSNYESFSSAGFPLTLTQLYCTGNLQPLTIYFNEEQQDLETVKIWVSKNQYLNINFSKLRSLRHLILSGLSRLTAEALAKRIRKHSLLTLDLSHSSGLTGNLSKLLSKPFPFLKSLVLSDCGLNSDDLTSLAEASVGGRLPELTDLDVSENTKARLTDLLQPVSENDSVIPFCTGRGLRKLNLKKTREFTNPRREEFYTSSLAALEEICVSQACWLRFQPVWERLTRLCVGDVEALEKLKLSSFPALQSLCIQCDVDPKHYIIPFIEELRRAKINVHHFLAPDNSFESVHCVCQLDESFI